MSHKDNEKRPVKGKPSEPEKFLRPVGEFGAGIELSLCVPEKRAEEENLQKHSRKHCHGGRRVVDLVRLNPRCKRLHLPCCRRYAKRHRRFSPLKHANHKSYYENRDGNIRDKDPEHR